MENNPMKVLYKYFGKEKEEGQEILNIANVFHEMGFEKDEEEINKDRLIKNLAKELK